MIYVYVFPVLYHNITWVNSRWYYLAQRDLTHVDDVEHDLMVNKCLWGDFRDFEV